MPWTAQIGELTDTGGGSSQLAVMFVSDSGATIPRTFNLYYTQFQSAQQLADMLAGEAAALDNFDATKAIVDQLRGKVGITSSGIVGLDDGNGKPVDLGKADTLDAAAAVVAVAEANVP